MIKDMEVECKTKFSMDVEFSFSFKLKVQANLLNSLDKTRKFRYYIYATYLRIDIIRN